ncbi:uncharacterized protein JCM15063_005664 [Sporobolomyces koalae]|uniref:uncharacterized protein n=1 Tax=Sporobolomyces koalae TaxID=500713 RepID=UPI00317850EF
MPHSPSYPFPRVPVRISPRPHPLSAFSTETTIPSIASAQRGSKFESGLTDHEATSAQTITHEEGWDRIGSLFATRRLTSSFDDDDDEDDAQSLEYSVASDVQSSLITLEEPVTPLSPFGNLALFETLAPLPIPDFESSSITGTNLSALILERFEKDGGFPWFETVPETFGHAPSEHEGQDESETTTHNSWKVPSGEISVLPDEATSRSGQWQSPRRPSLDTRCSFSSSRSDIHAFPPPLVTSASVSSTRASNRLRRATHSIADHTQPTVERRRNASLPVELASSSNRNDHCRSSNAFQSIKRALSKKKKKPERSNLRALTISPPLPNKPSEQFLNRPRTPPLGSEPMYDLVELNSLSSYCARCRQQDAFERDKLEALEQEVARLKRVVQVLIGAETS